MQTEKHFKLSGCLTPRINLIQCYMYVKKVCTVPHVNTMNMYEC